MSDIQEIDDLDAQVEALETSLGGAVSMAQAFDSELSRVERAFLGAESGARQLSSSISSGLRKAFDGLVFDGEKLSDAMRTVANSIIDATYAAAMKPITSHFGGMIGQGIEGFITGGLMGGSVPGSSGSGGGLGFGGGSGGGLGAGAGALGGFGTAAFSALAPSISFAASSSSIFGQGQQVSYPSVETRTYEAAQVAYVAPERMAAERQEAARSEQIAAERQTFGASAQITAARLAALASAKPAPFAQVEGLSLSEQKVIPFAKGGVVTSPTTFPMSGATGLMGEAGPEAIMPLSRGPDGSLGVRTQGQGAVNVTMNITTPDVSGFERSQAQIAAQMGRALSRGQRNR